MEKSRSRTLREIFEPWWMRWFAGPVAAIGVYDTVGSSQLGLPTLREVIGMSGSLMPWWGWLLVLQAFFVAGLFEYVRRNVGPAEKAPVLALQVASDDTAAPAPSLSEAERDGAKNALFELHGFLSQQILPFYDKLIVFAQSGNDYSELFKSHSGAALECSNLLEETKEKTRTHELVMRLLDLSLSDVIEALAQLRAPLANFDSATEWDASAQKEKVSSIINALDPLRNSTDWMKAEIETKRGQL